VGQKKLGKPAACVKRELTRKKNIRAADAKEVGVGNPAEETYCYPNAGNFMNFKVFVNSLFARIVNFLNGIQTGPGGERAVSRSKTIPPEACGDAVVADLLPASGRGFQMRKGTTSHHHHARLESKMRPMRNPPLDKPTPHRHAEPHGF
jgi:hypothetical protein